MEEDDWKYRFEPTHFPKQPDDTDVRCPLIQGICFRTITAV